MLGKKFAGRAGKYPAKQKERKMDTKESADAHVISIEAGEPWPRDVYPYFEHWEGEIMKATTDMRPDEFGAFMRLIGYYWHHGKLPAKDDFHIVARLRGGISTGQDMVECTRYDIQVFG